MSTTNAAEPKTDVFAAPATEKKGFTLPQKIGALSVAAALIGGTAWIMPKPLPEPEPVPTPTPVDTGETLQPDAIKVSHTVNDSMSFEQAFDAARHEIGHGGLFTWHGHVYNTFSKEEWSALSLQQRQEFLKDVGYKPATDEAHSPVAHHSHSKHENKPEPITIEGTLDGQRCIGLDFDHDGVIDSIVIQGKDGYTYKVVDKSGDQGLDTLYQFDPIKQETVLTGKLTPVVISNEDFQSDLKQIMTVEAMESMLTTQETDNTKDSEDEVAEDDDNGNDDTNDDDGYVNDAEMNEYNN